MTIAPTHGRQGNIGQLCKELMRHGLRKGLSKPGILAPFLRSVLRMGSSDLDLKDFSVGKTLHTESKDYSGDMKTLQFIRQSRVVSGRLCQSLTQNIDRLAASWPCHISLIKNTDRLQLGNRLSIHSCDINILTEN
ncbi:hypothetical protein [uncultured Cohaesibacter sp.]|uniref:hypothetical protein n=1 Tax=uncultured Cohaesibacter sp. TaxID=1002546 RepID=UPI0029C95468|nr:hypothetical protein [uncultured Cohaesibacter sp.]